MCNPLSMGFKSCTRLTHLQSMSSNKYMQKVSSPDAVLLAYVAQLLCMSANVTCSSSPVIPTAVLILLSKGRDSKADPRLSYL